MGWFLWFYLVLIVVIFLVLFLTVFLTKDPKSKANAENTTTMILFAFMIFALAVSASYSSIAATGTGGKDSSSAAHTLYTVATIFAWIGFAIAIIGIIALIYFRVAYPGSAAIYDKVNKQAGKGGGLVKICLWIIVILILLVGILCAFGAGYQGSSDNKTGYRAGIIAAVTSIILFVLILSLSIARTLKDKYKLKKNKQIEMAASEMITN